MPLPAFPTVATAEGVTRQVLSHTAEVMLVSFKFQADAVGKLHHHPHVQATYVVRGRFRFFRGDEVHELVAGDSLAIPGMVEHGCVCLEAGELLDSFTPRREDFL